MKKYNLFFIVVLLGLCFSSCKDDEQPVPTITLSMPEADATIDLAEVGQVAFTWAINPTDAKVADGYTLSLSKAQDLSSPVTYKVSTLVNVINRRHTISQSDMDTQLEEWGFDRGTVATVYWSVKSTTDGKATPPSEVRALKLKRLPEPPPTFQGVEGVVGIWEFSDASHLEKATFGNDLSTYNNGGSSGLGTLSTDGIRSVAGFNGTDLAVEKDANNMFLCNHGMPANSGNDVTQWTILYDLKIPASSFGDNWCGLLQTNPVNTGDAEIFFADDGTVYIYPEDMFSDNAVSADTWYRMIITYNNGSANVFMNGVRWIARTGDPYRDFNFSTEGVLFFGDQDGESIQLIISTIAIFNKALSATEVTSLGEPK